jgi:hypothetical protein
MKKSLVALASTAALAAAALPGTATAAEPDLTAGTGIQTESFSFGSVRQKVHVNAQSDNGADPRGHFTIDQEVTFDPRFTFKRHGTVTCHFVDGNRSVVAGRLDEPLAFFFGTFEGLIIYVQDNGNSAPDSVTIDVTPAPLPPGACPDNGTTNPVEQGNLIVKDR